MLNYDFLFILSCIFVLRLIIAPVSYADAICLTSLLAFKVVRDFLNSKKVENSISEAVKKNQQENDAKLQLLADELMKVKNSADGIKAAINFTKR